MQVVVDTNVVFSAMLSDSKTREILLDSRDKFYSPDFLISEIENHEELILQKSELGMEEYEALLDLMLSEIEVRSMEEYEDEIEEEARSLIGGQDRKDIPFIALALKRDCKVWSDDTDFQEQEEVEVVTTEDMIERK